MSATPPSESPLTPDLCRAFVVLHRKGGSLKAAAEELKESASALSRRLSPLKEATAGFPRPWLRKDGKKLLTTTEGERVLPLAQAVIDQWALLAATAARPPESGLTVACGQEASGEGVLRAARAFRDAHPSVPLRIAVVRGRRRIEGLASGQYDVALVTNSREQIRAIAADRRVTIRTLPDDELHLACPARGAWAASLAELKSVPAGALSRWPLLLPEKDAAVRQEWERLVAAALDGPPPAATFEVGGWRVLLGYVMAGFGVGLLPKSVTAAEGNRLVTRPLAPSIRPENAVRVVTRAGDGATTQAEQFAELVEADANRVAGVSG